jgi:hypothetical protein
MTVRFDLVLIGALFQLWLFSIVIFSAFFAIYSCYCMLLCCFWQRLNIVNMFVRLRPKMYRVCWGDFTPRPRE